MGKLKNMTLDEVISAESDAFALGQKVADLHHRASQGYRDEIPEPLKFASAFAATSRALADLASYFVTKAALNEQMLATEKMLRDRLAEDQ